MGVGGGVVTASRLCTVTGMVKCTLLIEKCKLRVSLNVQPRTLADKKRLYMLDSIIVAKTFELIYRC